MAEGIGGISMPELETPITDNRLFDNLLRLQDSKRSPIIDLLRSPSATTVSPLI